MSLGQDIGGMWGAVRDRIEVQAKGTVWEVTGGSFDSALDFARERFGDPVVLARKDRTRWWPRVTLTVTTDPTLTESAPPLEDMSGPVVPRQTTADDSIDGASRRSDMMPLELEAIFAHQEQLRAARERTAEDAG